MFTIIIIIIIMQNCNIINFILHHVYCNLVEYCNIVYCGTLCELYYICVNVRSNKINLVHKLYQELLYIIYEHMEHTPAKVSITQNVRPSVNKLWVSLVFYLKLRCLNINIYIYLLTVTRGLALYTSIAKYDASYSSPWNAA